MAKALLQLVHGPNMFVFAAFQMPLVSTVDRRFSVHQCWYQIQPLYELGDCELTRLSSARCRLTPWMSPAAPRECHAAANGPLSGLTKPRPGTLIPAP